MSDDEGLRRLREAVPFEIPRPHEIDYASIAEVKTFRRGVNVFRKWLADNVDGALMLARDRLVFIGLHVKEAPSTYGPTRSWEVKTSDISNLRRPKWLFGAGFTFDAGKTHYIVGVLGGTPAGPGSSGVARVVGGAAEAGAAVAGLVEAVQAVKAIREGGSSADHWVELLSKSAPEQPASAGG